MNNLITQLRENWVILVFIVSLIVSWTNTNARLVTAEEHIFELKHMIDVLHEIEITVAVIEEKVSAIEDKI